MTPTQRLHQKTTMKNKQSLLFNEKNLQKIKTHTKTTTIIAVTKTQPIQAAEEALLHNITNIGENKIQEIEQKYINFKQRKKITLHMIGHLQSNKIKKAVKLVDVIQTVENIKTISKIQKEAKKINKTQKIFLQINIGKDPNKKGISKEEVPTYCEHIINATNIELIGVMVILPQRTSDQKSLNFYLETKQIQKDIKKKIKTCKETSMGMSNDFKLAVKAGATQVRIGTMLFGKRK